MTLNNLKKAAEIAKSRTNDKRWLAAIDKAVAGVESGWIISELATCIAVTTESGETYFANGACGCKAFALGQACKHRALARLIEIANETAPVAVSLEQDVAASSRPALIAEIRNIWPRFAPGLPIEVELMARFKVNRLEMLADDMLKAVRLAVAA
jgi:hypothetical protein